MLVSNLPPGSYRAPGRLAAEVGELFVGLVEDGVLLLDIHLGWVLMRVAMETANRAAVSVSSRTKHVVKESDAP